MNAEIKIEKNAEGRLASLIAGPGVIRFMSCQDKEHPHLAWNVYGICATNEIVASVSDGTDTYYTAQRSLLEYPLMEDRIFGLDILDHNLAGHLSAEMWQRLEPVLVTKR